MNGPGLDEAIDVFFRALHDFTKRSADDVANVKRHFDEGYALSPQQFRERLKEVQRQCAAVEDTLVELETRTVDATTLAELCSHCLGVYQTVVRGVDVVHAHLRNYGYESGRCEKAPLDPTALLRDGKQAAPESEAQVKRQSVTSAVERRSSVPVWIGEIVASNVSRRGNVATHFDYSDAGATLNGPRESVATVKSAPRSSRTGSTLSQDVLQCSPGTLALKKKYGAVEERHNPSQAQTEARRSLPVTHDSFEFQPHKGPAENVQEGAQMEIDGEEGKGETGFADHSFFTADPVRAMGDGQGVLLSPRLSYNQDQSRFGSPFRSPHKKAETSIFTSNPCVKEPDPMISVEQYESLPQYLKGAVSHARLEAAFPKLREAFIQADAFQSQSALEHPDCIGDKFMLQAFVKLNVLERHFQQGILGYRLNHNNDLHLT